MSNLFDKEAKIKSLIMMIDNVDKHSGYAKKRRLEDIEFMMSNFDITEGELATYRKQQQHF